MGESKTQALARAYAAGTATVDEVIASAAAGAKTYKGVGSSRGDSEEFGARLENDEAQMLHLEGWDGVAAVYSDGGMTSAQFKTLYKAYMA